ncbi:MAG: hypothetical protein WC076_13850 [Terrimicrobiaceae bacterium]
MKQIANIALGIFLYCSATARGQEELHGVFSNEAEGFKIVTFMVHESGYAYFHASVAGTIGEWSYDKPSSILTFECFDPGSKKDVTIKFTFDSKKRTYTFVGDQTTERTDSSKTLHYITNAIPEQLIEAFKTYPEELAKERRRIQVREEQKRQREEKLAREKPEYERIRKAIVENPRVVISKEFYVREDTPATRALKSALGDRDIAFQQDVLVDLLGELPPDNHWIREQIFSRPELSAVTIEKFYPQALDWGKHLNYGILANIAKHLNTPRALVEDLATKQDVPIGAVGPAQMQIKKYAEELLAADSDTSLDKLQHLYECALRMPKVAHTDNGKSIVLMLAKSCSTPTNILTQIAQTDDQLVQRAIVSNTNTPLGTINQLAASRFPNVRADVVSNPAITLDTLLALSKDKEGSVRAAVAAHPATPPTTLTEMQSDEYFDVRRNLIKNPNTPDPVLRTLASDKYVIIKSEAKEALRERNVQNQQVDGTR